MIISIRRAAFALALCGTMPLVTPFYLAPATAQVAPIAPETVELGGIVRAPDGAPVAGAEVAFLSRDKDDNPVYLELKTDAQGRFVTRQPKTKWGSEAFVYATDYALGHAYLVPGKVSEIALETGAKATGKVVDAAGQTVANALIKVESLSFSAGDESDARARYVSIYGLPENSAIKRALQTQTDANGEWQSNNLPAESNVIFQLLDPRFARAGVGLPVLADTQKVPDLVATPGATLKGRVLMPDGKPLADAPVKVQVGSGRDSYASTQTAADGTFTLASLLAGAAEIKVDSPLATLAPQSVKGVTVAAGETVEAPDIKMNAGVLLTGKVVDKETKAPLVGARIMAQGDFGGAPSEATGADGIYAVRVPAGQTRFYVYGTPKDYLSAEFNDATANIGAASTQAPEFALQRGLTLSGTAFDETGAPAVNAVVSAGSPWDGAQTLVDAEGNWTLGGVDPKPNGRTLPAGKIELRSAGEWQIVGDGLVSARAGDEIALTLQRIELQDVTLRVVNPQGEPIEGAQTRIAIAMASNDGSTRFETTVTNARGEVTVKRLRPDESAELTPAKEGYALQKAGVIARGTDNRERVTDAVLTPKSGVLRGRVVDAAGLPIVGAQIAVIWPGDLRDPDAIVRSGADGRFALENLRAGELTIAAARGRDFGQIAAQTGGDIEIELAPAAEQPAPDNRTMARELLESWFASDKRGRSNLAEYAATVASLDPATAAQWAEIVGPSNKPYFDRALAGRLAASDPARALASARAKVGAATNPAERDQTTLDLASLLLQNGDTDGARTAYETVAPSAIQASKVIAPQGRATSPYRYAQLAGIAGAIESPDAEFWVELLARSLPEKPDDDMMFRIGSYLEGFAANDVEGALDFMETLAPVAQIRAYEDVIPLVAKRDLPRAQQLLERMETLVETTDLPVEPDRNDAMYRPTPARSLNVARAAVVRALLPTDPRAAYEQSRKISADGYQLERLQIDSALRLPAAEALPVLRAQFASEQKDGERNAAELARLASLVAPFDAPLSEQWFGIAREKLDSNREWDDRMREMAAPYAFYRADTNPAQSRLLLENEWQRLTKTTTGRDDLDSKIYRFQKAVWAMVPIDWTRAQQMLREKDELLGEKQYNQVITQRNFLMWLLASERERHEMNFGRPSTTLFE